MALVARIFALSVLAAGLGAAAGHILFEQRDEALARFVLACVGLVVGAVAGAAREVVIALGQRPSNLKKPPTSELMP